MTILEDIEKIAYQLKAELKKHIEISDILEIEKELSNIYYEAEKICSTIENRLRQNDIKDNYLIQLNGNYKKIIVVFSIPKSI